AAERARSFSAVFPGAEFLQRVADVETGEISRDDALLNLVTGWMSHIGPTSASELGAVLGIPAADIEKALLRMEASGTVLRGNFTGAAARAGADAPHESELRSTGQPGAVVPTSAVPAQQHEIEWCERRLLARIHRLTVGMLRKQIEPLTAAAFMRWLMRWQHAAPGTQVAGERGTLEVLQQLQGFEIPANAWERQVLARRIADYDPKWLDQLCLTGAGGWGRLSPHPATFDFFIPARSNGEKGNGDSLSGTTPGESVTRSPRQRRVIPTSVAPITFFVREDADWMIPRENPHFSQKAREMGHPAMAYPTTESENTGRGLSHSAQLVLD